ncbi:MAG: hybrid sensor histidine kinase/response regulator [Myxococcota bacterium]|nr:hybrid sensor histidine kinase/response regulator [Myxococcota bacterium]
MVTCSNIQIAEQAFHNWPMLFIVDRQITELNNRALHLLEIKPSEIKLPVSLDKLLKAQNLERQLSEKPQRIFDLAFQKTLGDNEGTEMFFGIFLPIPSPTSTCWNLCFRPILAKPPGLASHERRDRNLQELGLNAAQIAHDLNNAIMVSQHHLIQIDKKVGHLEHISRHTEIALKGIEKAESSIRRIRVLAQNDGPKTKRFNIAHLLNDVAEFTESSLPDGVTLVVDHSPGLFYEGYYSELFDALLNLTKNAIDAVTPRGRVTLKSFAQGEQLLLEVTDNGPGIPKPLQEKIFLPFFTTKGTDGQGLGLSSVKKCLDINHIQIELDSSEEGTTFRLLLEEITSRKREPLSKLHTKVNAVVIDDDGPIRDLFVEIFEELGHGCQTYTSYEEAISEFQTSKVDLVIVDLDLAGTVGWEVIWQIKQKYPNTRMWLTTGWSLELTNSELQIRGVDQVLEKPFTMEKIRQYLNQ